MVRKFEATVSSPAGVRQVMSAFGSPDYWLARFERFGGGLELTTLETDPRGAVTVETLQDVRREAMHPLVAKLYPRELRAIAREHWVPVDGGADGTIDVRVHGAPGEGTSRATLRPTESGSELRMEGHVRIRVPVLGGPIEGVVAGALRTHIPDLQRFTDEWIRTHV
ncbi:DUF2505 domain-containing protein [Tsukamurella asaccharolytica]|uniref:DUF2505 domain-containing protein n=1 Tax=Tsukamurella asaccharolytica TaxID=2592067 RepID=A0A5C5R9X3_9ACTN|nr:DUF2505 domain-containing protein [Tsukamurella asaccharolytica]TWS19909.1 DUF2505 domain-containing protein [Tsukamurella asaccharolytica]